MGTDARPQKQTTMALEIEEIKRGLEENERRLDDLEHRVLRLRVDLSETIRHLLVQLGHRQISIPPEKVMPPS